MDPQIPEIEEVPSILLPCTSCNRTFRPEALAKHSKVCEKTLMKKRKTFDSSKQRLQGTEVDSFPSPPSAPSVKKSRGKDKVDLAKVIHAAKKPEPPAQVRPSDHDECPYCGRSFGPKAFERHTQFCKEQQLKLKSTPNNQEAKERLKVRTSYRGPLTNKVLNRDRYQPKRDPSPMSTEIRDDGHRSRGLTRNSSLRSSVRTRGSDTTPPPPLRRTMTQINANSRPLRRSKDSADDSTLPYTNGQKQGMPRLVTREPPDKKLKNQNKNALSSPTKTVFKAKDRNSLRSLEIPSKKFLKPGGQQTFGILSLPDFIEHGKSPLPSPNGNEKVVKENLIAPSFEDDSYETWLHNKRAKSSRLPVFQCPRLPKIKKNDTFSFESHKKRILSPQSKNMEFIKTQNCTLLPNLTCLENQTDKNLKNLNAQNAAISELMYTLDERIENKLESRADINFYETIDVNLLVCSMDSSNNYQNYFKDSSEENNSGPSKRCKSIDNILSRAKDSTNESGGMMNSRDQCIQPVCSDIFLKSNETKDPYISSEMWLNNTMLSHSLSKEYKTNDKHVDKKLKETLELSYLKKNCNNETHERVNPREKIIKNVCSNIFLEIKKSKEKNLNLKAPSNNCSDKQYSNNYVQSNDKIFGDRPIMKSCPKISSSPLGGPFNARKSHNFLNQGKLANDKKNFEHTKHEILPSMQSSNHLVNNQILNISSLADSIDIKQSTYNHDGKSAEGKLKSKSSFLDVGFTELGIHGYNSVFNEHNDSVQLNLYNTHHINHCEKSDYKGTAKKEKDEDTTIPVNKDIMTQVRQNIKEPIINFNNLHKFNKSWEVQDSFQKSSNYANFLKNTSKVIPIIPQHTPFKFCHEIEEYKKSQKLEDDIISFNGEVIEKSFPKTTVSPNIKNKDIFYDKLGLPSAYHNFHMELSSDLKNNEAMKNKFIEVKSAPSPPANWIVNDGSALQGRAQINEKLYLNKEKYDKVSNRSNCELRSQEKNEFINTINKSESAKSQNIGDSSIPLNCVDEVMHAEYQPCNSDGKDSYISSGTVEHSMTKFIDESFVDNGKELQIKNNEEYNFPRFSALFHFNENDFNYNETTTRNSKDINYSSKLAFEEITSNAIKNKPYKKRDNRGVCIPVMNKIQSDFKNYSFIGFPNSREITKNDTIKRNEILTQNNNYIHSPSEDTVFNTLPKSSYYINDSKDNTLQTNKDSSDSHCFHSPLNYALNNDIKCIENIPQVYLPKSSSNFSVIEDKKKDFENIHNSTIDNFSSTSGLNFSNNLNNTNQISTNNDLFRYHNFIGISTFPSCSIMTSNEGSNHCYKEELGIFPKVITQSYSSSSIPSDNKNTGDHNEYNFEDIKEIQTLQKNNIHSKLPHPSTSQNINGKHSMDIENNIKYNKENIHPSINNFIMHSNKHNSSIKLFNDVLNYTEPNKNNTINENKDVCNFSRARAAMLSDPLDPLEVSNSIKSVNIDKNITNYKGINTPLKNLNFTNLNKKISRRWSSFDFKNNGNIFNADGYTTSLSPQKEFAKHSSQILCNHRDVPLKWNLYIKCLRNDISFPILDIITIKTGEVVIIEKSTKCDLGTNEILGTCSLEQSCLKTEALEVYNCRTHLECEDVNFKLNNEPTSFTKGGNVMNHSQDFSVYSQGNTHINTKLMNSPESNKGTIEFINASSEIKSLLFDLESVREKDVFSNNIEFCNHLLNLDSSNVSSNTLECNFPHKNINSLFDDHLDKDNKAFQIEGESELNSFELKKIGSVNNLAHDEDLETISEDSLEYEESAIIKMFDDESVYSDSLQDTSINKSPILFWNNQKLCNPDAVAPEDKINSSFCIDLLCNTFDGSQTYDLNEPYCFEVPNENENRFQSNTNENFTYHSYSENPSRTTSKYYHEHTENYFEKSTILPPISIYTKTAAKEEVIMKDGPIKKSRNIFKNSEIVEENYCAIGFWDCNSSTDTVSTNELEKEDTTIRLKQCSKTVEYFQDGNECHTVETSVYKIKNTNEENSEFSNLYRHYPEHSACLSKDCFRENKVPDRDKLPPICTKKIQLKKLSRILSPFNSLGVNYNNENLNAQYSNQDIFEIVKDKETCSHISLKTCFKNKSTPSIMQSSLKKNICNSHTGLAGYCNRITCSEDYSSRPKFANPNWNAKNGQDIHLPQSTVSLPKITTTLDDQFSNSVQSTRNEGYAKLPSIRLPTLFPPIKLRKNYRTFPRVVRHVMTTVLPKRFSLVDGEKYNPYLSAERQMMELFGGETNNKSPTTLPEIPSSPLQSSPTSAFVKYRSSSIENLKEENNNPGRLEANTGLRKPDNLSLSNLSLCSVVSIDSVDCNRNQARLDEFQRSFSAADAKPRVGRSKVNMKEMLYGDNGEPPGNLEACEAELLISMMEFEKMLKSSPTPSPQSSPIFCSSNIPDSDSKQNNNETENQKNLKNLHQGSVDSAYSSLTRSSAGDGDTNQPELPSFCHECGAKYPVAAAKFCCNCGMKRIIL